jgi:predicted nucleic acid-binding protein
MRDLFPGYVIDTNALIDLWRRRYPRDNELSKQHDELYLWAKKKKCFKELDTDQIAYVKDVLRVFPSLIDEKKTIPDADPFVVALALAKGWKVVTSENPGGTSPRKRIPDVCEHFSIKCLSLLEFFREKQWNF